jgi:hypothetical protein
MRRSCIYKDCTKNCKPTILAHLNGCLIRGCSTPHPVCEECFAKWHEAYSENGLYLSHEVNWQEFEWEHWKSKTQGTNCDNWTSPTGN